MATKPSEITHPDMTHPPGRSVTKTNTLTAFFDSRGHAESAAARLRDAGIPDSCIQLIGRDSLPQSASREHAAEQAREHEGIIAGLLHLFMPEEDRHSYAEGLSRGGYLVTVSNLTADQHMPAVEVLAAAGAVDMDEREETWRREGWKGYPSGDVDTSRTMGHGSMGRGAEIPATPRRADAGAGTGSRDLGSTETVAAPGTRATRTEAGAPVGGGMSTGGTSGGGTPASGSMTRSGDLGTGAERQRQPVRRDLGRGHVRSYGAEPEPPMPSR